MQTQLDMLRAFASSAVSPSPHLGPDDPELVWGPATSTLPLAPHWRGSARFEAEQVAAQCDQSTDNGSRRPAFLEQFCQPIDELLARRHLKVLQAGSGVGNWIPFLSSRVGTLEFVGVERSVQAITEARRRYGDQTGIEFIKADLLKTPPLGQFDLVLLDYELLNHFSMTNAQRLIAWAGRHLLPGGRIFGDIRLQSRASQNRNFIFEKYGVGVWYRDGCLSPGVEGRAAAFYELSTGNILRLFQDVLWVPEQKSLCALFEGHHHQLKPLAGLETDKAECKATVSFVLS